MQSSNWWDGDVPWAMKLRSNFSRNSSDNLSSGVKASSPTTAFIAAASRPMAYFAYYEVRLVLLKVNRYQLIRHVAMIFSSHAFSNGRFHQSGKGREDIDRRIYLSIMQLTIHKDLAFSNIASEIWNRMRNVYTNGQPWSRGGLPSFGIVKMGICVMEPFLPSTRPARS